jgi:UDP-N-acetylglucosamine 2-epimerase (non-hydrolysing)
MQPKMRVMTIVGTRPELIRLSLTIAKLDQHCDHHLVHTGQNYDYELNQIFFEDLGIRAPDVFLEAAGETAAETIGKVIIATDGVLADVRPEALLILGDTNSSLAAIAAKRRRIPIFHMEAGNRSYDQRVPEEINRRIVDSIADINLTYSRIAREYLLREGFPPDQVIRTGSPMDEVLAHHREKIERSDVLDRLGLSEREFFVVSAHREENVDGERSFARLLAVINGVAEQFDLPVILSTHPRTRKRIEGSGAALDPRVRSLKPLGFSDYVKLQMSARATLSDSGTISEESSILNFPAVNLREAHERPEAMEEGAVMMTGLKLSRVLQALDVLATQERGESRTLLKVADYVAPNVSEKVLRIILSYTDYIRRRVWMELD